MQPFFVLPHENLLKFINNQTPSSKYFTHHKLLIFTSIGKDAIIFQRRIQ